MYSSPSSVKTGVGSSSFQEGYNVLLFGMYGLSSLEWKEGKMLGKLGRSRVYDKELGKESVTEHAPSHHGKNLVTHCSPFFLNSPSGVAVQDPVGRISIYRARQM